MLLTVTTAKDIKLYKIVQKSVFCNYHDKLYLWIFTYKNSIKPSLHDENLVIQLKTAKLYYITIVFVCVI